MAKRKAKKPTKRIRPTKSVPISEEEYLELLISKSESAITGHGNSIDDLFTQQAARLRKQLEDLRNKNRSK